MSCTACMQPWRSHRMPLHPLLQVSYGLSWANEDRRGQGHRTCPTLDAVSLQHGMLPSIVLAAGAHAAAVVSAHGHDLDMLELPVSRDGRCRPSSFRCPQHLTDHVLDRLWLLGTWLR